jgi:hypothetical protein
MLRRFYQYSANELMHKIYLRIAGAYPAFSSI